LYRFEIGHFAFLSSPFGGLGATDTVHHGLIDWSTKDKPQRSQQSVKRWKDMDT